MSTRSPGPSNRRGVLVGIGVLVVAVVVAIALPLRPAADDDAAPIGGDRVPASIAADCSKNVEVELSRFINSRPPGSTVQFPADGCYAQGGRIEVRDKRDLTIDGNGASFKSSAPNSGLKLAPNWLVLRGRDVRLRNMKIVGNFHLTGARSLQRVNEVSVAGAGNQFNMGVGIYGGDGIHVTDTRIDDVFGDGVAVNLAQYVDGPESQPLNEPRNVHIERVKVKKAARHCFSPSSSAGFWLEESSGSDCWYGAVDAELDAPDHKLENIHILRNTFSDFNLFGIVVPVAGDGTNTKDIEIRDNTFKTPTDAPCNTIIEVGIYPDNPNTFKNVVIADNKMKTHGVGIALDHVQGGRVSDNRIDYKDKNCAFPAKTPMVRVKNSTGVTVRDNGAP